MNDIQNLIDKYFLGFLALIVGGVFALVGYLNPKGRQRVKELNDEEDRLLNLRKEHVEELTVLVAKLQATVEAQTAQLAELTTKYDVLAQVFQGRDEDSIKYRSEGRATMKIVAESKAQLDALKASLDHHEKMAAEFRRSHEAELQRLFEGIMGLAEAIKNQK